jgi:hypothetical protein
MVEGTLPSRLQPVPSRHINHVCVARNWCGVHHRPAVLSVFVSYQSRCTNYNQHYIGEWEVKINQNSLLAVNSFEVVSR